MQQTRTTTVTSEQQTVTTNRTRSDDVPDLSGSWKMEMVTKGETRFLVVGRVWTKTRSTIEIEIQQEGRDLELRVERRAAVVETSSAGVSVDIQEEAIADLPDEHRSGRIESRGGVDECVVFGRWRTVGVELEDPEDDELPETGDDPRIVDLGGDGKPGMTVGIQGLIDGQMSVITRWWDRWRGEIDGDEIRGVVEWRDDKVLLDASSRWLHLSPDLEPVLGEEHSYFRMRRIDG